MSESKPQILALLSIVLLSSIVACKGTKVDPGSEYSLTTLKASTWEPVLVIRAYDFNTKNERDPLPVFAIINGLTFNSLQKGARSINDIIVRPSPETKMDIGIYYIGKTPFRMGGLELKRGDSVILDVKMEDSLEPLH